MAEAKRLELRQLLGERLGIRDENVLNKLYNDLESEYSADVGYALQEPDTGLEDLVKDIEEKRWLEYYQLRLPRTPVHRGFVEIELDERERGHAEALKHYLARQAATLPEVRQFRDKVLENTFLTSEQAEEHLRREVENARLQKVISDLYNPSDIDSLTHEVVEDLRSQVPKFPNVQSLGKKELVALVCGSRPLVSDEAIFPIQESSSAASVSDELTLCNLGAVLASLYPWSREDAIWFVLTREPPEVVSLGFSYHPMRRVFTLTFAPWVSEETLRQAYRKGRDRIRGGKDNRQSGKKALAVLRFVSERTPPEKKPKWTELMKNWNIECRNGEYPPDWKFKDVSAFRKTYLRSEQRAAN